MILEQEVFGSVRSALSAIPNLSVPTSVAAAVARMSRGELGVVYYETAVVHADSPQAGEPGWETGTHVRVCWINDTIFGTIKGHSPSGMWNGQISIASEPEHLIGGSVERLENLQAVRIGTTPVTWFDQTTNEFEIEAPVTLGFSGGASLAVPEYPIHIGGSHQRAALDVFIDAALSALGR